MKKPLTTAALLAAIATPAAADYRTADYVLSGHYWQIGDVHAKAVCAEGKDEAGMILVMENAPENYGNRGERVQQFKWSQTTMGGTIPANRLPPPTTWTGPLFVTFDDGNISKAEGTGIYREHDEYNEGRWINRKAKIAVVENRKANTFDFTISFPGERRPYKDTFHLCP